MRNLIADGEVGVECLLGPRIPLRLRRQGSMINKVAYGQQLRQFGNAAVVIGMKVRDQRIVDLFDARLVSGSEDAVRVTGPRGFPGFRAWLAIAGVPGIDEQ